MSHGGGGVRKEQKKCHVLFEWPLSHIFSFGMPHSVFVTDSSKPTIIQRFLTADSLRFVGQRVASSDQGVGVDSIDVISLLFFIFEYYRHSKAGKDTLF